MIKKRGGQAKLDVIRKVETQPGIRPEPGPARPVCWLEERSRMITEAAYFRAERRGFAPGGDLEDWLRAEADIDRLIQSGGSRSAHSAGGS